MTAVVVYMNPEWTAMLSTGLWLATAIFATVLLSVWCVRSGRRAMAVGVIVTVMLGQIIILNPCHNLTPSDWEWWVLGCFGLPSTNQ